MSITLHSENLELEPIQPSHAEKLFDLLQSPDLYHFIPQNPPKNIEALKNKYIRWSKGGSDNGDEIWLNYAIYSPTRKTYVGTLQATIMVEPKRIYIAYEVFPAFQKQGIAKEACRQMIEHLLSQYAPKELLAHVDTRNTASVKLLESLGFRYKETLYNADEFKGNISDEYVYSYFDQTL